MEKKKEENFLFGSQNQGKNILLAKIKSVSKQNPVDIFNIHSIIRHIYF